MWLPFIQTDEPGSACRENRPEMAAASYVISVRTNARFHPAQSAIAAIADARVPEPKDG